VQTAEALGVSYKRLHGWEPRRVTVHYDADGAEVGRSVTTTEVEWDVDQRQIAVGLTGVRADTCGGCGQPLSLSMDPASAGDDESEFMYEAKLPVRCHGCTAKAAAVKAHEDGGGSLAALHFGVERVKNWRVRGRSLAAENGDDEQ